MNITAKILKNDTVQVSARHYDGLITVSSENRVVTTKNIFIKYIYLDVYIHTDTVNITTLIKTTDKFINFPDTKITNADNYDTLDFLFINGDTKQELSVNKKSNADELVFKLQDTEFIVSITNF